MKSKLLPSSGEVTIIEATCPKVENGIYFIEWQHGHATIKYEYGKHETYYSAGDDVYWGYLGMCAHDSGDGKTKPVVLKWKSPE